MGKLARESILVTIFIAVGVLIGAVTNIFFFPYIASKPELGEFKLFLYWSSIFSLFASMGTQGFVIRSYHSFKESNKIGELNFMMMFIPLSGLLAILLLMLPFTNDFLDNMSRQGLTISNTQALVVLCLFTVFQTYIRAYSGAVILMKRNAWLFFNTDILARINLVISFSLFAYFETGLYALLLMVAAGFFLQVLFILYHGREIILHFRFKIPDWSTIVKNFKMGGYLMLDSAAAMLIIRLDIIMIGYMALNSNTNTQEFDMANNLSLFIFMPWRTLTNTSIPFIVEAFRENNMQKIEMIYKKTSLHLLLIGSIIFTFIFSNVDSIIKVIPDDYTAIKFTVLFLGIAKIVDMTFSINNNILVLSPYYRYNLLFSVILIAITIGLNFVLIPLMGITGTAISALIVVTIFNLMKSGMIYKKYGIHPFHINTLSIVFFMGIIFAVSVFIPAFTDSSFVNIAIRGTITALMTYAYLIWKKPSEDLEKVRLNFLKRLRLVKK